MTCRTVKYVRAVAASPATSTRDVGELVQRPRRVVVVQDHRVVELPDFGRTAADAVVTRRAHLGVREECGHAVEITVVEQARVLVDERRDRVHVVHRRHTSCVGIRE